jgi:dienelactone hydrolase
MAAAVAVVALITAVSCEAAGGPQRATVSGLGAGLSWWKIPSATESGRWVYFGSVDSAAQNTGPRVLIIPGGGGQVSVDVKAQAKAYAAAGLRPLIACIATITGMWEPSPATGCPGTPAAKPGHLAAGREVANVVDALRAKYPSLRSNPNGLVIVGDSYGGAAAIHAAELTRYRHPVVTVNGTNTWRGATKPVVPGGDVDPAAPQMLDRIEAPIAQVVGADDEMVPPGVAINFARFAAEAGRSVPVLSIRGADHIGPINADPGSCAVRQVVMVITALASAQSPASRSAC